MTTKEILHTRRGGFIWTDDEKLELMEWIESSPNSKLDFEIHDFLVKLGRSANAVKDMLRILVMEGNMREDTAARFPYFYTAISPEENERLSQICVQKEPYQQGVREVRNSKNHSVVRHYRPNSYSQPIVDQPPPDDVFIKAMQGLVEQWGDMQQEARERKITVSASISLQDGLPLLRLDSVSKQFV